MCFKYLSLFNAANDVESVLISYKYFISIIYRVNDY